MPLARHLANKQGTEAFRAALSGRVGAMPELLVAEAPRPYLRSVRRLSASELDELVARYENGVRNIDLARHFGIDPSTVWKHLHDRGVESSYLAKLDWPAERLAMAPVGTVVKRVPGTYAIKLWKFEKEEAARRRRKPAEDPSRMLLSLGFLIGTIVCIGFSGGTATPGCVAISLTGAAVDTGISVKENISTCPARAAGDAIVNAATAWVPRTSVATGVAGIGGATGPGAAVAGKIAGC